MASASQKPQPTHIRAYQTHKMGVDVFSLKTPSNSLFFCLLDFGWIIIGWHFLNCSSGMYASRVALTAEKSVQRFNLVVLESVHAYDYTDYACEGTDNAESHFHVDTSF
jgi:hypothetical protein